MSANLYHVSSKVCRKVTTSQIYFKKINLTAIPFILIPEYRAVERNLNVSQNRKRQKAPPARTPDGQERRGEKLSFSPHHPHIHLPAEMRPRVLHSL